MTIAKRCISLLSIFLLVSCATNSDDEKTTISNDTFFNVTHSTDTLIKTKKKTILFDNRKSFTIVSFKKSITEQSSAPDTNMCKGWSLNQEAIHKVIEDCQGISGTEWDLSFEVLPCIVKGQLSQAGHFFNFEVNGGSWINITCGDTTLLLGNYNKGDRKYFITKPNEE